MMNFNYIRLLLLSIIALTFAGCATVKEAALKPEQKDIDIAKESIALLTVKIEDLYQSDIQLFKKKFPYLVKYEINNHTLPQWSQPIEKERQ